MRAQYHAVTASILAAVGGFSLSNTYLSNWSCNANIVTRTIFCGSIINYQSLTLGSLFVSIAAIEAVMALRRKRTGATVWETDKQRKTRRLGIASLAAGAVLSAFVLLILNNTVLSCPVSGCTAAELWRTFGIYEVSFYVGTSMAIIGAALVLVAAFMGVKLEKWRMGVVLPTKEAQPLSQ